MIRTSSSDISSFLGCRRQWYLSRHYTPAEFQEPLAFGGLLHVCLEKYYGIVKEVGYRDSPEILHSAARSLIDPLLLKIWEEDYKTLYGPEFGETFTELVGRVLGVFEIYCQIDPIRSTDLRVLEVEKKIELDMGNEHTFVGIIDLILQDPMGNLIILDHKSKKSFGQMDGLDVDFQMTSYALLLREMYGRLPSQIIYNLILRSIPQPPIRLSPTSTQPVRFSKSKDQPTTAELYRKALREAGLSEQGYEEIIAYFEGEGAGKFNLMVGTTRNDYEASTHRGHIAHIIMDMKSALDSRMTYPNPSTTVCSWCPFLQVCKSMNDGGDYMSILSSPRYRPVSEEETK